MALVLKDRVKETTTTTGVGTVTLAGAVVGFQSFSVVGNANSTYYAIVGATEWEVGIGTYTASGTTLSRDTVLESSNAGAAVSFSAGTKDVFITQPAEKIVDTGAIEVISGNTTAVNGTTYIFTATLTLTLPATPGVGNMVGVSNQSATTTPVIGRNGTNIMGLAEDMTIDVADVGFSLVYTGATKGWVVI